VIYKPADYLKFITLKAKHLLPYNTKLAPASQRTRVPEENQEYHPV